MKNCSYLAGILKRYVPATHRAVTRKLSSYFGPQHPALSLRAPHVPSMESAENTSTSTSPDLPVPHLSILLLSAEDGRDSLVDLTKTLTEMSQRSKISSSDISIDLVDAEISESVMGEPDLLILFGPTVELSGYPPWQIRLTEIFHVEDNQGVGYQVFLRALYNYANAQMRFGR
jgi:dehydrodolichyl diphosphate syntase complex subunit NUS1